MPPKRLAAAQPLGPRRANVILSQRVQKRASHHPREDTRLRQSQRNRRQTQALHRWSKARVPARKAARAKPAQIDREDQNHQHRKPEIRDRHAKLSKAHHQDVSEASPLARRPNPRRKSNQRRKRQRIDCQRQTDPHPLANHLAHRCAISVRCAKIAAQHPADPACIALKQRPVQPELLAQRR